MISFHSKFSVGVLSKVIRHITLHLDELYGNLVINLGSNIKDAVKSTEKSPSPYFSSEGISHIYIWQAMIDYSPPWYDLVRICLRFPSPVSIAFTLSTRLILSNITPTQRVAADKDTHAQPTPEVTRPSPESSQRGSSTLSPIAAANGHLLVPGDVDPEHQSVETLAQDDGDQVERAASAEAEDPVSPPAGHRHLNSKWSSARSRTNKQKKKPPASMRMSKRVMGDTMCDHGDKRLDEHSTSPDPTPDSDFFTPSSSYCSSTFFCLILKL